MAPWRNIVVAVLMLTAVQLVFAQAPAQDVQELRVRINTSAINQLISVQSDFNQTPIIPNYEYAANLDVTWAIPDSALTTINSQKVLVFISVRINERFPFFYFRENGGPRNSTTLTLTCIVADGRCANDSRLSASIPFFVKLENASAKVSDEDVFVVQASVTPFGEYADVINKTKELDRQADELNSALSALNMSDPQVARLRDRLDSVKGDLSSYSITGVSDELKNISATVESLKTQDMISQYYPLALGIAVLLAIAVILVKLREKERKGIGIFSFVVLALGVTNRYPLLSENIYYVLVAVGIILITFITLILIKRKNPNGGSKSYKNSDRRRH
jgi:uncharacterized membrane protein YhaH (DUF805 family)